MKKMKKNILALACLGLALTGAGAYQLTNAQTAQADGETVTPTFACAGASIRLDSNTQDGDTTGIRFRVKMDNTTLTTATAGGKEVRILVMPTDLIGEDNKLTVADTGARDEALTAWADFVNDNGTPDDNYKQAYAYTYGMTEAEWNRPTTWRAYYLDGNNEPVYSDQMERSLSEVALSLENDTDETTERREMAKNYIKSYTVTYDFGVRDTDGEWKTTTQTVRYGDELPTESAPETRDDFEFLAWETTKGTDKLKEDGEKTIVTGNVTKEAYWLLRNKITINSTADLLEYADVVDSDNAWTISAEAETDLTITSKEVISKNTCALDFHWKNIIVPTAVKYEFAGSSETSVGYFNLMLLNSTSQWLCKANAPTMAVNKTLKSAENLITYGTESNLYKLGDIQIYNSGADAQVSIVFSNIQITSLSVGGDTFKAPAYFGEATSYTIVNAGVYVQSYETSESDLDYVHFGFLSQVSNKEVLTIKFNGLALTSGQNITIKMKIDGTCFVGINSAWTNASILGTGVTFSAEGDFVDCIVPVTATGVMNTLNIRISNNSTCRNIDIASITIS